MEYSKEPVPPTKSGYTFGGWYEDQAYTRPYTFNTLLTYMKVVYAKCVPVVESQVAPAKTVIEPANEVLLVSAKTTEQ